VRIHSPAMSHPCYLGVDTARREELIAHRMSVAEIARHIGADSLGYLSLPGLFRAVGKSTDVLCSGCFTGDYPVPVQLEFEVNAKVAHETAGAHVPTKGPDGQLEVAFEQIEMDLDRVPVGAERQL
ncbi:MAG: hypothetical protein ABIO92_01585, partial [Chloroflexia bacterium]